MADPNTNSSQADNRRNNDTIEPPATPRVSADAIATAHHGASAHIAPTPSTNKRPASALFASTTKRRTPSSSTPTVLDSAASTPSSRPLPTSNARSKARKSNVKACINESIFKWARENYINQSIATVADEEYFNSFKNRFAKQVRNRFYEKKQTAKVISVRVEQMPTLGVLENIFCVLKSSKFSELLSQKHWRSYLDETIFCLFARVI